MISSWKRQAVENMAAAFTDANEQRSKPSETQLKELEQEKASRGAWFANLSLENEALKDVIAKKI